MILAGITGTTMDLETESLINDYKVGGIILYANNLIDSSQGVKFLNEIKAKNESQNKSPLLLGVDQEGGRVSKLPNEVVKLPTNKVIGSYNNSDLSFELGSVLGEQVKTFGFNVNFAPVLDINSNPKNPVIGDRSFGNDLDLVTELGIQTMKGIQSQNVISVVKHFPGHGDTALDSHFGLPEVNKTLDELRSFELIPFEQAIKEGADAVMVAHILLPNIDANFPSSMSRPIITDLLRNKLGFDGVVMTDDMTMHAITNHFDIGQASVESIKAGSDIIMVAHNYSNVITVIESIKSAIQNNEITEERINTSVKRIQQLKQKYEVTDNKVIEADIKKLNETTTNKLSEYIK